MNSFMPNGMGNDKIIYSSIEGMPAEVELKNIMRLYTEIFKDADLDFFKDRCKSHPKLFSVLAFDEVSLVGFKMGYPYSETVFYSWIGGVLPRCRHQGIGKGLAKIQEQWAVDQGFTVFVVSWKSADETLADIVWDDYIRAQIEAIDEELEKATDD